MIDILNLYPRFFRVLAIAKVGGFNLAVYADKKEYGNAQSDFVEVKKLCEPFFKDFGTHRDYDRVSVSVELEKPLDYFETVGKVKIVDFIGNLNKAKGNNTCYERDNTKDIVIKTVVKNCNLSLRQAKDLIDVAFAIAQLEGDKDVSFTHILEASQYVHTVDGKKFDILL